jgi:hypothetical protein
VFEGAAVISVPITLSKSVKPGALSLGADVRAQGCNATACLPPATIHFTAPLTVGTK